MPIAVKTLPKLSELQNSSRDELLVALQDYNDYRDEWLRRQIVDHNRIDILAEQVLKYQVKPFHLKMLKFQFEHPDSLQLAPRGMGKSTICTITKVIHLLCCDRNLRILLASKTKGNAENFLKEIKGHLESNEDLIRIFGEFYHPKKVRKWTDSEIDVAGKTKLLKESSVTCLGVDSAIVSRHYDVIISDDLVDEENARTAAQRLKTRTWYYQTMDPTLEPPEEGVRFRGEHHRLGTRYHYDDLWGHLIANELKDHHNIVPALDDNNQSPWPEKFSSSFLLDKKEKAGTIIFNAQYQNDCEAMKGEIFRYDDCQQLTEEEWPDEKDLQIFMGIDLAIKESESTDQFAICVIGIDGKIGSGFELFYVLDYFAGQLRFSDQTTKIANMYNKWDPISGLIESNAYQLSQYQEIRRKHNNMRIYPHHTSKDKMTRAWKLSPFFENKRVFFKKGAMGPLIDQLVLFPNHKLKDLFDALDLAFSAAKKRRGRKKRVVEPGVL
jgi:phage terminase large subunit-like protein